MPLCRIQIYATGKQNRLTAQAEYGMILMLGGLLAACFLCRRHRIRTIKNAPLRVPEKPYKSEMTLDYCFLSDSRNIFL